MARTKIYTAFDGDSDMNYYRTLQMWSANSHIDFSLNDAHDLNYARDDSLPESIINQLRARLDVSKAMILLVGEKTKGNRKGILKYEINYALRNNLPILLSFIGFDGTETYTSKLWADALLPKVPTIITDADVRYCLISPFTKSSVEYFISQYSNNCLPNQGYTWVWKQ
jgi:hypothetical protein